MRRLLTLVPLTLAAVLVLAVSGASGRGGKTVQVGDDFFSPASVTISKGDKVKFKWVGSDDHNVIKKKGPGGSFGSGTTDQTGFVFKHKFSKAGTYKIICTVHEDMKMKVKVN